MLVVADTSALISLAAGECLTTLDVLFDTIRVPPTVFEECTVPGKPHGDQLREFLSDKVVKIDLGDIVIAAEGLGTGELAAMALYKHLHAQRLLVDDDRARRIARFNDIETIGSLGVLLLAKEQGLIEMVKPRLDSIRTAGIHLSDRLIREVLRIAGE